MIDLEVFFVEIGMLWLFHIFCSDAPIAFPLFNLVRNSVVHSPSSVIRDPRYGNVFTCANCSFWMSMRHAMPSLSITLVLSILMNRLYLRLTRSRRFTSYVWGIAEAKCILVMAVCVSVCPCVSVCLSPAACHTTARNRGCNLRNGRGAL